MSLDRARLAELAKVDLAGATPVQRDNLAKLFGVHASALEPLHSHARRSHPPPPPPGPRRVSDSEYASMTTSQRLDYARGFDQKQFAERNPTNA